MRVVPQGGEERLPSALAPEGEEQATETVQRKRRGGGFSPWAKGLGTEAGDIQAGAQAPLGTQTTREMGGSSQSPSCSSEMLLMMSADRPPEGNGDFLEAVGAAPGATKPVCLGPAARPPARVSMSLSWQGIWPRLLPFQ